MDRRLARKFRNVLPDHSSVRRHDFHFRGVEGILDVLMKIGIGHWQDLGLVSGGIDLILNIEIG